MSFMKKLGDAFNKAGEKAGEFADFASDKASTMATQTKYKMEQQKLRGKIPTLYKELGEKIYLAMKDDLGHDVLTATVADYTKQIDEVNAEIVELDKKIEEVAQGVDEVVEVEEQVVETTEAAVEAAQAPVEAVEAVQANVVEEVQSTTVASGEVPSQVAQETTMNSENN